MKVPPWFWLVLGHAVAIAAVMTLVMIARQHPAVEVPLH